MEQFKLKFKEQADKLGGEIKIMLQEHGNTVIGETTLAQIYQGMRGMTALVTETSLLDAQDGIRFKRRTIPELRAQLPKAKGGNEPLPEALFYLMLIGEIPTDKDVENLSAMLQRRSHVPAYVFDAMEALPEETHPMTQFVVGVMALQNESVFAKRYADGFNKKDYWEATLEDTLNLIARLPHIAAFVYRRKYKGSKIVQPDGMLDWAANFAHMLGYDNEEFKELMRLYMVIHSDHEGGNVSAHATHLVGSALSDPYLSYAAGMNGLAGPLHGLANQEVIKWIFEMQKELKTDAPTSEQIAEYVKKTLSEGKVVPGYGHAVLRQTDPRFTAQMEFGKKHMPNDPLVNTVWRIYETVPPILQGLGKVKNPWPNVDAHSGALLVHYGMKEYEYYTVLFAVSRSLGVLSSLCWDRALGMPLERPKSVTTAAVKRWLNKEVEHLGD
ncbi:citrate (Si)-synthase, eukaryotic [Niabella soli]|uniref:citrate synthase (unknown stereospecificity) n=1 Tax=Niabella soli DSM 19437 TaxID=929713 RepID=W0EW78_9BACT|nr:citrate (Si)-synthase, eukaryotic [Niabella soli]AHF15055.1 type I citrate synthase [Niabella soli DSM 19437]